MQAQAYEGYFNNGQFYVSGKSIRIPEKRRVVLTVFNDNQNNANKKLFWDDFKREVNNTAHENNLLDNDAFIRVNGGRELIDFSDEV